MKQSRAFAVKIVIALWFSCFTKCTAQVWTKPYLEVADTPSVTFDKFIEEQMVQPIRMDEEIEVPYPIAFINYAGTATPQIGRFKVGFKDLLGVRIQRVSDRWVLEIALRQDYENINQRFYAFDIEVAGTNVEISLRINNIFDVKPSISYDPPCRVKELYEGVTDCLFRIIDLDGMENNKHEFKIDGKFDDDEHFALQKNETAEGADDYTQFFSLYVIKELFFDQRALYSFTITVTDAGGNLGTVATVVEVIDVPNKEPIWQKPLATARFPEKEPQQFQVIAVDGDTQIDTAICYKVTFKENENYTDIISIERTSGLLNVKGINRDERKIEIFPFNIYAFKCNNESSLIFGDAVLVVDDKNDNYPEITLKPNVLKFKEETFLTLDFQSLFVNDIDLGKHATYNVKLVNGVDPFDYSKAFTIIPTGGYQNTSLAISVATPDLLDYENLEWRKFEIVIMATETDETDRFREKTLRIELINWNDELPIFSNKTGYLISIPETILANTFIVQVEATDRDEDDYVSHSIVGRMNEIIECTENGRLSTITNDTFDYERLTSVVLQINATDNLQVDNEKLHTVFAQLTINIIDVNDETPEIRMPRQLPQIMENSPANTVVTEGIYGYDPDTSADLEFTIDWKSSYATKAGQEAEKDTYENCFIIEPHFENRNTVYGHLMVNPTFTKKIDYESYEVIYLTIIITDHGQKVRDDSAEAVLTVRIQDENDNPPEFSLGTLSVNRSVIEEALTDTPIGTINAFDLDGPGNNNISYFIKPANEETPTGWVEIDVRTGVLRVLADRTIGCDIPQIFDLDYEIRLNDFVHNVTDMIKIRIFDINNKVPQFEEFKLQIEILEKSVTGTKIVTAKANDLDRDVPHRSIHFLINYIKFPGLSNYFEIDELTGELKVRLQGPGILDRDSGDKTYDIHIDVQDNYLGNGIPNVNSTVVHLILLDINDNAPQMVAVESYKPSISENTPKNTQFGGEFIAKDIDDESTPNAQVEYQILAIEPGANTRLPAPPSDGLFEIDNFNMRYGVLRVAKLLEGFYGTWHVTIEAYDHGHEWTTNLQLKSNETYEVTVNPFNFNTPKIVFPQSDMILRLSFYDNQIVHQPLVILDGTRLRSLEADDPDGGEFGDVSFEITSTLPNTNDADHFELFKESAKKSRLQLAKEIAPKFYYINVVAVDGGGRKSNVLNNLTIAFVKTDGEPVFVDGNRWWTNFTETELGLDETQYIPVAVDPKNAGATEQIFEIYYFIDKRYLPEHNRFFRLNESTRALTLAEELDRETIDFHQLKIVATNKKELPSTYSDESTLLVDIIVNDVNDNPPKFRIAIYGSGITNSDYVGKVILTVQAEDPDLDDIISYKILTDTITAYGENIEAIKDQAFALHNATGVMTLRVVPQPSMKGYFEFKIEASDLVQHKDIAAVKIFVIAESNRVLFIFLNTVDEITANDDFLLKTFSDAYEYECHVDDIENGADSTVTNVRTHFIRNNEAIEASAIQSSSNDPVFLSRLRLILREKVLVLQDVPATRLTQELSSSEELFRIALIVISTFLSIICIGLLVAFILRTRTLKRKMKELADINFGSRSSNLNQKEAPTTNVFSVEGSNPVLNNNLSKGFFDNLSILSEESDFVGIQNDNTFTRLKTESNMNECMSDSESIGPYRGVDFFEADNLSDDLVPTKF